MTLVLAFLFGIVGGMRTMMPLAAVSWAAVSGRLMLEGSWLSFFGAAVTPYITTLLALAELVVDQLPSTASRKVPVQFGARILVGALCGAAIGFPAGSVVAGAVAGAVGAVIGTLGGAEARRRMALAFGDDRPAALIEDAVAIVAAVLLVLAL